jgi:hypothetical protein
MHITLVTEEGKFVVHATQKGATYPTCLRKQTGIQAYNRFL